jgi:hypothetical protein
MGVKVKAGLPGFAGGAMAGLAAGLAAVGGGMLWGVLWLVVWACRQVGVKRVAAQSRRAVERRLMKRIVLPVGCG